MVMVYRRTREDISALVPIRASVISVDGPFVAFGSGSSDPVTSGSGGDWLTVTESAYASSTAYRRPR